MQHQHTGRSGRLRRFIALGGAFLGSILGCQAFVDTDVAGGIGAPCDRDVDCQASKCMEGTCALECKSGSDCPEGTICSASHICQLSFGAAWVFASNPKDQADQWEMAHDEAVPLAIQATPFLTQAKAFPAASPKDAGAQIDAALAEGYTIVFGTSPEIEGAMAQRAQASPTIHFITAGGVNPGQNRSSLSGRQYKSWYLAGIAAASKATHKRLGMIASYVTPSVVANTNAFLRGAQSVDPDIVVEVRWTKVYSDRPVDTPQSIETRLAAELLATDCDVIAHQSFDGFAVDEVEKEFATKPGIWSIGNNLRSACDNKSRCLGVVYWNWAPLYAGVLAAIHSNQFNAGGIEYPNIGVDANTSVPNFTPGSALDPTVAQKIASERQALAMEDGVGKVFTAPTGGGGSGGGGTGGSGGGAVSAGGLAFTDGTNIAPGEALGGDELRGLCRFFVGVVEKTDPADATSADKDALVPPEGDCTPAM